MIMYYFVWLSYHSADSLRFGFKFTIKLSLSVYLSALSQSFSQGAFHVAGGRGRGRGGGISSDTNDFNRLQGGGAVFANTSGSRGRGFMRRPFQHGGQSTRGGRGGLKTLGSFNSHGVSFFSLVIFTIHNILFKV